MRRAIVLSAFGLATTSPNPPVGCVILDRGGHVVGEGYHERKGEAHAEVRALTAAGHRADGATAVVTLEPCNHHGRTPPCRQALIDAGIARVVIALLDPTSREDGGAARLRAAGVDVEVGVLAEEAQVVLGPWLRTLTDRRPRVTWAYYLDVDGPAAVPESDRAVGTLHGSFDAVMREGEDVREGASGTHGAGAFTLSRLRGEKGVEAQLAALYRGGTRFLLLDGGMGLARPFLEAGVVDHVRALVARPPASGIGPPDPGAWPLVPDGFVVERVERIGDVVAIAAATSGHTMSGVR